MLLAVDLSPRAILATSLFRAGPQLRMLALPIAVAGIGCLLGTVWGERVLGRISAATYRRLVGIGVAAVGVWLLARAP